MTVSLESSSSLSFPLVESSLSVDIDQIECYDQNPRLLRNPKWLEIERSIRASRGLTETLSITQRPDDDHYIVHQGGNTRLQILKKLLAETADEAFRWVKADIKPYNGEFDLAALHDRENNCRGDLSYFEQAWSKYNQYQIYCRDALGKPTSAAFVQYLQDTYGDQLSRQAFSRMRFAVETLFQHIPACLVQGAMSQRAVRHLIRTRSSLKLMWKERKLGPASEFETTFYNLLTRQDKDLAEAFVTADRDPASYPDARIAIDWSLFRDDLAHELTIIADVDHQRAEAWIAPAFRSGTTPVVTAGALPPSPAASEQAAPPEGGGEPRQEPSLLELRAQAFHLARAFAATCDLSFHIVSAPDSSFGYQLGDVPEGRLTPVVNACWSILAISSDRSGDAATAPSIRALLPKQISLWSKLLGVQARIAKKMVEPHPPLFH